MSMMEFAMGYDRDAPKQSVNLLLNEALVREATRYTANLDQTLETLLDDYIARERDRRQGDATEMRRFLEGWDAYHAEHGLLSDELLDP